MRCHKVAYNADETNEMMGALMGKAFKLTYIILKLWLDWTWMSKEP